MTTAATTTDIAMRPFSASLPMALLRAREAAMRLFRPLLAEHDLTEQQWRVLRALAATGERMDVGALADRTFLLGPSLSRILTNLEGRGLIDRTAAPDDQRRSLIALDPQGAALVSRIAPSSEATYNRIESQFGSARLSALLGELHDLAALDAAETLEEPA
ncbi:MAG: homoprotocatechuate degradation operon regulator HpaR [Acidimicrobiales bacterium]